MLPFAKKLMTWNAISNLQAIFSTSEQMLTVTNTLLHRNVTKEWYKVILPSSSALKIQKILTYEHKKEHLFKETRFQDGNLYEVKCRMLHHLKGTSSLVIYSFLQMMYQHFFHSFLANSTFHCTGDILLPLLFLINAWRLEGNV